MFDGGGKSGTMELSMGPFCGTLLTDMSHQDNPRSGSWPQRRVGIQGEIGNAQG